MWMTLSWVGMILNFLHLLSLNFKLEDLGSFNYFLGLQITWTSKGLILSQTKYYQYLFIRHNMHTSKPARSLMLLTSSWFPIRVLFFPILNSTKVWLALSIISPSLVLIWALLLLKCVNSCPFPLTFTWLQSNTSLDILMALSIFRVFFNLALFLFQLFRIQIEHVTLW